jgi:hypothetical protein
VEYIHLAQVGFSSVLFEETDEASISIESGEFIN